MSISIPPLITRAFLPLHDFCTLFLVCVLFTVIIFNYLKIPISLTAACDSWVLGITACYEPRFSCGGTAPVVSRPLKLHGVKWFMSCICWFPPLHPLDRCVASLLLSKLEGLDHRVICERSLKDPRLATTSWHPNSHTIQASFFNCICSMALLFTPLKYWFSFSIA